MTKTEMIAVIAAETKCTKRDTGKIIDVFMDVLADRLAHREDIMLTGFGTFSIAERAPKIGRNSKTGEVIKIPPTRIVRFKPSNVFNNKIKAL